jgi:glutathione synthase/RimK-type ligase-like ATP-grasp enzyme
MLAVAFLSTDNLEAFFVYDELLVPHFKKHGWSVETVSWHSELVNWDKFDYVIVRSTWDYQQHAKAFLACLDKINASKATLLNSLPLIKWNIEKHYLKDLEKKGVSVVDTVWGSTFNEAELEAAFLHFNCETVVIKPVLSANADDTFQLSKATWKEKKDVLFKTFRQRDFMIQPFLHSVVEEGEYSLFYFNGAYSHAIKKVPQQGDFRVQEEHGGSLYSVDIDSTQDAIAQKALSAMPCEALYARVDLVRQNNEWAIMELELIEPSLYFNLDEQSAPRFVKAVLALHESKSRFSK